MNSNPAKPGRGFTLIELSLVVLIIGLLIGAVLAGTSLIRAAEFRRTYSEFEQYAAAIMAFKSKYGCLPGDCPNAASFFGAHPDCPSLDGATFAAPANFYNDVPMLETCDGDGDLEIDAAKTVYEMTTLWQHLADAGMIGGMYSGGTLTDPAGGPNLPVVSGLSGYSWIVVNADTSVLFNAYTGLSSLSLVPRRLGNVLSPADLSGTQTGAFTPSEAYGYDSKFDDGMPATGRIIQPIADAVALACTDAADETTQSPANAAAGSASFLL
ncbi:MAG: prepilin-type N-terminal cleavage/methylation domain-containing protein [Planctomycetaceae bacterium]|nr:prepilin-type N-terminal cleavage/methylation domain-containing protein [Planctomycetaceae bacterium]